MTILRPFALLVLLLLVSCDGDRARTQGGITVPVCYPGESAYREFVSKAQVNPAKAKVLLYASVGGYGHTQVAIDNEPMALVNRCYLFTEPHKVDTAMRGYYVNGDTGEVRFIDDARRLEPTEHKLSVQAGDFRAAGSK